MAANTSNVANHILRDSNVVARTANKPNVTPVSMTSMRWTYRFDVSHALITTLDMSSSPRRFPTTSSLHQMVDTDTRVVYTVLRHEPATPASPTRSPSPGNVADEIKRTVEKHVEDYLSTRAASYELDSPTTVPPALVATSVSTSSSSTRKVIYWLTLLGGLCGSVNNIWNVFLLLRRVGLTRTVRAMGSYCGWKK